MHAFQFRLNHDTCREAKTCTRWASSVNLPGQFNFEEQHHGYEDSGKRRGKVHPEGQTLAPWRYEPRIATFAIARSNRIGHGDFLARKKRRDRLLAQWRLFLTWVRLWPPALFVTNMSNSTMNIRAMVIPKSLNVCRVYKRVDRHTIDCPQCTYRSTEELAPSKTFERDRDETRAKKDNEREKRFVGQLGFIAGHGCHIGLRC